MAEKDPERGSIHYNIGSTEEYILNDVEKAFILAAERGDIAGVKKIIDDYKNAPQNFNINCVDPMNRSALISAIENENIDLIRVLLENKIEVGDALLHAISEEYVEAVEELLLWEENNHKPGQPYSWECIDNAKATFTPDITPLILAAHRNNYEILKLLLDRGATLPMPHDVKCGCDECVTSQETDSLCYSQSRINAYRALSASSLIALSSRDPVLTAFELSWELKRLQNMESEFRSEYLEMRRGVQEFVTSLLDHTRTSNELEIMLNYNHEPSNDIWSPGQRQTLERLKLAIKYKQKTFVAHPNVQQLLATIWYEGLPGFRRRQMSQQVQDVIKLGCTFPINSIQYLMAPDSPKGKLMKKPFVKFISHSSSYMFFLFLLSASSLRIVQLTFELLAFPWMLNMLEDWRKHERGSLPGPIELGIITYISSLIFGELNSLYSDGLFEYIRDLWNIVDFISNMFYMTWILCRATAWVIVHRDLWYRNIDPYFPREHWHPFDPMLLSEGAFAAGMVFSYLKLVHIFSINPHLGPLQVSLGRMIIDIIKFFFIYTLVLFAFGCGLNQLLWYYAELEKNKCYHLHPEVSDFDDQEKACTIWRRFSSLFETSQSLFWASFGLVDLVSFDLAGIKSFTRFWALLMFGSYSVINIIVLLNMLIAMMSNSYQLISEHADVEWKFARSQLWMSYFEDGGTVPPPFNLMPSVKLIRKVFGKTPRQRTKSFMRKSKEKALALHEKVMKLLIRRYITAEQRRRDDFGITEDDIIEVRQDISSLRFELLDIFQNNSFNVPDIERKTAAAGTKKGKVIERRILKDFQIGFVESLQQEMDESEGSRDIFSSLARAMGKKKSGKGDKDWNEIARKNTISADPIGTKRSSLQRRTQRSLRRQILEQANEGLKMSQNPLIEFNPNLGDVTRATRVAYVKFMKKKMEADDDGAAESILADEKQGGDETTEQKNLLNVQGTIKKLVDKEETKSKDIEPKNEPQKTDEGDKAADKQLPKVSEKPKADSKPITDPTKVDPTKIDPAKVDPTKVDPTKKGDVKKADGETVEPPTDDKSKAAGTSGKSVAPQPPARGPELKPPIAKPVESSKPGAAVKKEKEDKAEAAKPETKSTAPAVAKSAVSEEVKPEPPPPKSVDQTTKTIVPGITQASDGAKSQEKSSEGQKSDDKKSDDKSSDDKKPDEKKSDEKKPDEKKSDEKKPEETKKPAPPKPPTKVGQSSAAAGGERGKSTVTGRMISGWL